MNWSWSYCARYCEKTYGAYVDWDEEFFICPECGEPIYKCDWDDHEPWTVCPVCEWAFDEEEEEDDEEDTDDC
jgi:hypothetical protein